MVNIVGPVNKLLRQVSYVSDNKVTDGTFTVEVWASPYPEDAVKHLNLGSPLYGVVVRVEPCDGVPGRMLAVQAVAQSWVFTFASCRCGNEGAKLDMSIYSDPRHNAYRISTSFNHTLDCLKSKFLVQLG